jgi:hypothetical protein
MQAIYRTDVFAPQDQLVITTSGSMQRADVFARRERRVAVMTPPEPRRLTSQLAIDGDPIVLTYTSVDHRLPNWTTPVLQSLSARWGSGFGWDSYQAQPTNPQLTPLADGGVQAEWHCNGRDLELVVAADEQRAYYYSDPGSGVEEEAEINANYPHIQALIGGIS